MAFEFFSLQMQVNVEKSMWQTVVFIKKPELNCVTACNGCHGEECNNKSDDVEQNETESDNDFERNIFDMFDQSHLKILVEH